MSLTPKRDPSKRRQKPGPIRLESAINELMAIRGFNRRNTNQQLAESWQKVVRQVAGQSVADQTKVTVLRNGILQVAVANSATLGELKSFHHLQLLVQIQSEDSKIKDIKYRLNSNMKKKSA